jgi:hypothetical protein
MAHKKDFIPGPDAEFDLWLTNLVDYVQPRVVGSTPAWPHIPLARFTALRDAEQAWHGAFVKTTGAHTKADTDLKNETRKAATKEVRLFIKQFLRFPPVTNEDRDNMRIPNYDDTRTPIGKPATRPAFRFAIKDTRLIAVIFRDAGSASRGKPYGIDGAVIRWSVLPTVQAAAGTPPPEVEALRAAVAAVASSGDPKVADAAFQHSVLATRSPHLLEFAEAERGMTVYAALSWQNETGKEGTMTEIQSAVIP